MKATVDVDGRGNFSDLPLIVEKPQQLLSRRTFA
jgi:hypothetical protein